ncbi:hypothetical protein ACFYTQ_20240 [Nocardia sp. NPDC004068]|uniref:hypothetical protein n=1 Tax=Nocardia sp. NPDC004068 TaxID=3364303 RepID=UPI0036CE389C
MTEPNGSASRSEVPFPQWQWVPAWPISGRSLGTRVLAVVTGGALVIVAVVWIAIVIVDGLRARHIVTVIGGLGGASMVAGIGFVLIDNADLVRRKPRAEAYRRLDGEHGPGVVLRPRRTNPILYLALGGVAVYGIAAWLAWRNGFYDDGLLPLSKNNQGGATFALIFGVVSALCALVLAVLLRWKLSVELYPLGVKRPSAFPGGDRKDRFVKWEDVASAAKGEFRSSAQAGPLPTIDLYLRTPCPPVTRLELRLDRPDRVALPVYALAGEVNTVLAVVRILVSRPESRACLAHPDAPAWFTPPPLAEQQRLSKLYGKGNAAR